MFFFRCLSLCYLLRDVQSNSNICFQILDILMRKRLIFSVFVLVQGPRVLGTQTLTNKYILQIHGIRYSCNKGLHDCWANNNYHKKLIKCPKTIKSWFLTNIHMQGQVGRLGNFLFNFFKFVFEFPTKNCIRWYS